MNKERLKGVFPALLTPFKASGEVNCEVLRQLVDYNLAKDINGFYVGGSTGEGFLLTPDEHYEVYSTVAQQARGKTALIAHIGDMSISNAIEYAKMAEKLGYDAISSVTPFYYRYSASQIIEYYRALTAKCSLPMIVYHIPALSGVSVDVSLFDSLLQSDEFIGVKFTSNDFFSFERLRNRYPDKLLYNGYDEMLLSGLAMGADGGIGSTYNLMAERFVRIYKLAGENKYEEALLEQHKANDIIESLIDGVDVKASLKFAISKSVEIDMGLCRPPQTDVPEAWKKAFVEKFENDFIKA